MDLITIKEASIIGNCHSSTIYNLINSKKLEVFQKQQGNRQVKKVSRKQVEEIFQASTKIEETSTKIEDTGKIIENALEKYSSKFNDFVRISYQFGGMEKELKFTQEKYDTLQKDFDELLRENEEIRRRLKEAEEEKTKIKAESEEREKQIVEAWKKELDIAKMPWYRKLFS
jgi:chromosome segregation ATPase